MANERIVSPGVFTRERDLSFLTQGISEIGGAFIGPTPKGPAFIPTIVRSQQEYVTAFGEADATHYTGLTAKNYLRESGVATVVRVLGLEGYDPTTATPAVIYASGSAYKKVFAVLHPTSVGNTIGSVAIAGTTASFNLELDVDNTAADVSASGLSTNPTSPAYIGNFFGYSPDSSKGAYIYAIFPDAIVDGVTDLQIETSSAVLNFNGPVFGRFTNATTPWVQSQTVGGTKVDLFKLHTLSDGNSANKEIKASFLNMKAGTLDNPYGTFSMLLRRFNDLDTRLEVVEQYDNVNLDPDSPNFIARVIGNSAPTEDQVTGEIYYQGDFPNRSQYVRVEMSGDVIPPSALPYGFAAFVSPVSVSPAEMVAPVVISTRWISGSTEGYVTDAVDRKLFYGWNFGATEGTNPSYLNALPSGALPVGPAFSLESLVDVPLPVAPFSQSIALDVDETLAFRRFTVPFQGGFDGVNPARDINLGADIVPTNSQGFNLASSITDGSKSYKKALQAISNPDQFDFNLLVLPGVIYEYHSYIANEALSLCESRGDAFYIMDTVGLNATLATATGKAAEIDSSYAATYYPWLRVIDVNTNKLLWVPPSVILPEIYAYNDNIAAEWFAPAGLNRGGIASAVGVKVRLPQPSRDILYEGKVNPIAQFPGQGICVWGQKTLQRRPSALDRVNVRRLLIALKKYIASVSRYLVFEQNVEATRNRFLNIVNPYLASVQERSGLYAFRVIMDESNNTPDVIDRNILFGQIYLQPTKTAEFIILDFNVLPTGAVFPTA
jgi:phage tail sheath protein FI